MITVSSRYDETVGSSELNHGGISVQFRRTIVFVLVHASSFSLALAFDMNIVLKLTL